MKPEQNESTVYENRYKLIKKIGAGSFGEVCIGEDLNTHKKIAIKLEKINTEHAQLRSEYNMYTLLRNSRGIPNIHWFGIDFDNRILVMDFIGPSLENIYANNRPSFTVSRVMKIGINILEIIEIVHTRGIIHKDIKPANFLMNSKGEVYIIDFGLSKMYRDPKNGAHIAYSTNKKFTGTPRYSSKYNHNGFEQSRRDDIISIGYMLVYLMKGRLPWQGLGEDKKNKYSLILDKKTAVSSNELCDGLPNQMVLYMNYADSLNFEDCPNYEYLKGLMYSSMNV